MNQSEDEDFRVDQNGILKCQNRVYVPYVSKLKKIVFWESYRNNLSIHPRDTGMSQDLKKMFWWQGIKRDIAQFFMHA